MRSEWPNLPKREMDALRLHPVCLCLSSSLLVAGGAGGGTDGDVFLGSGDGVALKINQLAHLIHCGSQC